MRENRNGSCDVKLMLSDEFRKLWEQHIQWTRAFIISTAAGLNDLGDVTKRLLRNPVDFEEVLKPYYGKEKSSDFRNLLTQHLTIAADLVNAAKNNDLEKADEARKKWYKNADDIAEFLASINPFWRKKDWQEMLYEHLRKTEQEAVLRLEGKYAEDIAIFDKVENDALTMADAMTNGILRQSPCFN